MAKEIFIQLGMPKTGTTTLQNRIFQNHEEYLYLGKHNPGYPLNAGDKDHWLLTFKRDLVCKDLPFFEDFNLEQVLFNQFGEAYSTHDKLFLSEESILGRCITPGKYGDLIRIGSAYAIFNKLKVLFDNSSFSSVKFILVLRKQDDLIESFFAEEYHNFKTFLGLRSPGEFINYLFNQGKLEEIDSLFRYYSLVTYLDSLFGEENVLVLPYEKLKTNPEEFLSQLSSFMGIKLWDRVELVRQKKDNNRDVEKKNGKIAKIPPFRKRMAQIKNQLIGDIPTGLGNRIKFIDKFQKNIIVELDRSNKEKVLLSYKEDNRKLQNRVKYMAECNYY